MIRLAETSRSQARGPPSTRAAPFAVCLLIPESLLCQAWRDGIRDPDVLAERFNVSVSAIHGRLGELELFDPDAPSIATDEGVAV